MGNVYPYFTFWTPYVFPMRRFCLLPRDKPLLWILSLQVWERRVHQLFPHVCLPRALLQLMLLSVLEFLHRRLST